MSEELPKKMPFGALVVARTLQSLVSIGLVVVVVMILHQAKLVIPVLIASAIVGILIALGDMRDQQHG